MNIENPEERAALHQEIQAAIAAGREVGPDMDKHLADSVLDRYAKERAARERAVTPKAPVAPPAPHQSMNSIEAVGRTIVSVILVATVAGVLLLHPGDFWILFFIAPMLGSWWGRGRRGGFSRRSYRHYDDRPDDRLSDGPRHEEQLSDSTPQRHTEYV